MVRIKRVPQTGLRITASMESPHRVTVRSGDNSVHLDMPELLGGDNKGLMPLEALLAAYAGSLNVVGNFVAKTMDFELRNWEFTIWAEFDPRGIWGLGKVEKPIRIVHIEARVDTDESEERLKKLRKVLVERDPVHTLLRAAGVRFKEEWRIGPVNGASNAVSKPGNSAANKAGARGK